MKAFCFKESTFAIKYLGGDMGEQNKELYETLLLTISDIEQATQSFDIEKVDNLIEIIAKMVDYLTDDERSHLWAMLERDSLFIKNKGKVNVYK